MPSKEPQSTNKRIPRPIFNVRDVNLDCPVRDCASVFVKKDLLQHFNTAHQPRGKPVEICERENVIFKIPLEAEDCKIDEVQLIGVLAYKGTREGSLPTDRALWVPNEGFAKRNILKGSLPIVLVGSWTMRTVTVDVKAKKDMKKKTEKPKKCVTEKKTEQKQQKCFLIWALTGPTNMRFQCSFTALADRLDFPPHRIAMVRRLHLDSQIAHEIPLNETGTFFCLSSTDVAKLTRNFTDMLTIEVNVMEEKEAE